MHATEVVSLEEGDDFLDGGRVGNESPDRVYSADTLVTGPLPEASIDEGATDAGAGQEDGVHGPADISPGLGDTCLTRGWVLGLGKLI